MVKAFVWTCGLVATTMVLHGCGGGDDGSTTTAVPHKTTAFSHKTTHDSGKTTTAVPRKTTTVSHKTTHDSGKTTTPHSGETTMPDSGETTTADSEATTTDSGKITPAIEDQGRLINKETGLCLEVVGPLVGKSLHPGGVRQCFTDAASKQPFRLAECVVGSDDQQWIRTKPSRPYPWGHQIRPSKAHLLCITVWGVEEVRLCECDFHFSEFEDLENDLADYKDEENQTRVEYANDSGTRLIGYEDELKLCEGGWDPDPAPECHDASLVWQWGAGINGEAISAPLFA